jgi:DNA-binding FrmR family transcriptional regulator
MHEHDHEYMHTHGIEHSHSHHGHVHSPEETKAIANRLARAIGHLEHVKMMVEEGRDCSDVLVQLSAVKSALNSTGLLILQSHIEHCIVESVKSGDMEAVQELNKAIARYIK